MLTLTLGLGVAVSLLLLQLTGLSAGGVIAPGYVALVLDRPGTLLGLALISLACWGLVALLSRWLFLYGARRFGLTVLLALVLGTGLELLQPGPLAAGFGLSLDWGGLAYIVPGLIAHQFDRQGLLPTLLMLAVAAPLVRLLATLALRW